MVNSMSVFSMWALAAKVTHFCCILLSVIDVGSIIGGSIGSIAALMMIFIIIVVLIYYCYKKKGEQSKSIQNIV